MLIEASAPTRIDLAGGTLDIWPLYLFHDRAQTLNAAISLRAYCTIRPRTDQRMSVSSGDSGAHVEADDWDALLQNHDVKLVGRLLRQFRVRGVDVHTRSDSPVGAGIAGSSALNIAICGALAAWSERSLPDDLLLQIAQNVEAQVIGVPTGVQDYRPALYGGVSAVELKVDGVKRVRLGVDPQALQSRLVLAYTNASRNSGINNWDVTKRHIDGDAEIRRRFATIRDIAIDMRDALEAADWPAVGRYVAAEWENRKGLAPGVTTPAIDAMLAGAVGAGAYGGKVCGAGGGGCLFCIGEPERIPTIRTALAANGARLLDFTIESDGLTVELRTKNSEETTVPSS